MKNVFAELVRAVLLVVAALFPIVNPLGSALLFLTLTRGYSGEVRRHLAGRIAVNSFLLLVVSILIGTHVLNFFGISIPVVQVAGGLIVSATGWNLLQQRDAESRPLSISKTETVEQAFYPLTLPITVGPGSISVAVTLGANTDRALYSGPVLLASALLGPSLVALSVYLCYRSAEKLETLLGDAGLSVFLRLSAFIVICIGVQIFWNGIAALVHGL